jgi:hypothetical protein
LGRGVISAKTSSFTGVNPSVLGAWVFYEVK